MSSKTVPSLHVDYHHADKLKCKEINLVIFKETKRKENLCSEKLTPVEIIERTSVSVGEVLGILLIEYN